MTEDVKIFTEKLCSFLITEETILEEKLSKFMNQNDPRLISLINHEFFAGKYKLTNYLKNALEKNPKSSQLIRKKILNFIALYIETHYLYLVEHAKQLFAQLFSHFWKQQGRIKEVSLKPVVAIIESFDENFLLEKEVINPVKIHNDIMNLLLTHKKEHGVIGQCWHLLAVIQNKFTTQISAIQKKKIQQNCFIELKGYINQDKNFNTITALLLALAKSLKENYFSQEKLAQLYNYVVALMNPLRPKYNVPLAALQLLQTRSELFKTHIMSHVQQLFDFFRENVNHKNKEYSLKILQVFMVVIEIIVKGILSNKQKYKRVFAHMRDIVGNDLSNHVNKNKDEPIPQEKKGFNLLTIVRLLGIMSPLYLMYEGKETYKKIFDYIIKKCTKKIIKDSSYQPAVQKQGFYQIKYILYSQKELKSFISALAQLIEQLEQIEYDAANQLQIIFIQAVKESKFFLSKYENDLWQSMVQLVMSINLKGAIFSKWTKKVISQSLKECLDSSKLDITTDVQYIKMIDKAAHLWKSLINHISWRSIPLSEFTQFLMANIEYLILNLDCGYKIQNEADNLEQQIQEDKPTQDQGIINIFFTANQRIVITKAQDYRYLSSLSLLFNELVLNIDPTLYNDRVFPFYHRVIQKIKAYPKCLPLLRILRTLNQFINKTNFFKTHLVTHRFYCEELLQKMRRFFNQSLAVVFKYQEQFFYELLKILLSFSEQVYFLDNFRIIKYQLAQLIIKGLQFGQQIISLGFVAIKCLKMLFLTSKQVSQNYLSSVIPVLQKYINIQSVGQKQEIKSHLFLYEQNITKQSVSEQVLSFLGSLGGLCHLLVDNKPHDHISWDYDCHLEVDIMIFNQKYKLNLVRILNRVCWLAVNGRDDIKVVSCQLLHAVVTFVIQQVVTGKMSKQNLSIFLDRVLPTVLSVAGNTSHPSQQLIHTLLIQFIHFFANTKQPNSPDIQIILKHLLSLYNKSEDMGFLASKCLSEIIRWHIKQQVHQNGDVPILKALISNIWALVGNKNARDGIITFLVKLLKIIHRQQAIMNYYALQLGFLLLSLTRSNNKLQNEINYLVQKYTACLKRYMKFLIIRNQSRKYKTAKDINQFLEWLYKSGFLSRFKQQRQTSYLIWHRVILQNQALLQYNHIEFLKVRANSDLRYLFGHTRPINFTQIQQTILDKFCWRVVALGQLWLKMLQYDFFGQGNLAKFEDLQNVYLVSFVSFLGYIFDEKNKTNSSLNDQVQNSIMFNLKVFLKILNDFGSNSAVQILRKFIKHLKGNQFSVQSFDRFLFYIIYEPQKEIKNFNRDFLIGEELDEYIQLFINYKALENFSPLYNPDRPLQQTFSLFQSQFGFNVSKFVDYICQSESLGERKIRLLLSFVKISYKYQNKKNFNLAACQKLESIVKYMIEYIMQNRIRQERIIQVIYFILTFKFESVIRLVIRCIYENSQIYQRYQKQIIRYIVQNWEIMKQRVIRTALSSVDNIKIIYVLIKKLNEEQVASFTQLMPEYEIKDQFLRDLLKINFILAQNQPNLKINFINYLQKVLQFSLRPQKSFEVHEQALYLCGLLIQKEIRLYNIKIKDLKVILNQITNKYCPYVFSKIKTPEDQQTAFRYLSVLRNFIIISEEFIFMEQIYFLLADQNPKEYQENTLNQYIQDCVRTCFTLDNDKPRQWIEGIFQHFFNVQYDLKEWSNTRYALIDRIFRKIITFVKLQLVQQLFNKHINRLQNIISKPCSSQSIKSYLLDLQEKKGALLIVELLYGNLPRREKKEATVPENEIHKILINHCKNIVKNKLEEQYARLMRQHDQASLDNNRKVSKVYREYCCHAYNCLIILFISTQLKKQSFKIYLFDRKQPSMLWQKLVDTNQTDFGFQIQTQFKVMKPLSNLRNNVKQLKAKIEKKYFESSLYVIEEENIPKTQLQPVKEQNQDQVEKEPVAINNANNILIDTQIEEDNINKHPCMVNLLRVVDFLHKTFPQANPGWMQPIEAYLSYHTISLAQRILLIKLILNRPNIFNQLMWAKHLLAYLALKQTGSKYVHYFYRDTLKRYLKFLPNLTHQYKPDILQVHTVLMKVIFSLPHSNVHIFTDNVDIVDELLRVPGIFVQKDKINKMLKGGDKQETKNEWRLSAIIVLKLCLTYKVPIYKQSEFALIRDRPNIKYKYYYQQIKPNMKSIYQMAVQSSKKYRTAAAGLLGQFLDFILNSAELNDNHKKEHFNSISHFLNSLTDQKSNRTVKERFSLALQKISVRFPSIFADEKIFASFEDAIVHYNGQERYQLFLAFQYYIKNLLQFNDTGKISNFFMILRVNWQKMITDTFEVQLSLLRILNICTDPRILRIKDIIKTYFIVLGQFGRFIYENEALANEYFLMLINIKKFLKDKENQGQQFHKRFLQKIIQLMIAGLTCKFQAPLKVLFSDFQKDAMQITDLGTTGTFIKIFNTIYIHEYQYLWLNNVVPLILSLSKNSSDYSRLFSDINLNEKMPYYDWDFRNFRIVDASLPYTPFTMFKRENGPQIGISQSSHLRGLLKATQNNYPSQQQQIFTLLESLSPSLSEQSSLQNKTKEEDIQNQEDQKYGKINDLFRNRRKRNQLVDDFKAANMNKTSAAVRFIQDKIRFAKKVEISSKNMGTFKKRENREKIKKGAILRAYKLGELPNIQISLQNIIEPLIYISAKDFQLSSELFLQLIQTVSSYSIKNCDSLKDSLIKLLKSSQKCQFNFVSTIQKGLIKMCQKQKIFLDISMKELTIKSNTLDYAVLFTEENLIQGLNEKDANQTMQSINEKKQKINGQWGDLADYYQLLNQHDLIQCVIIKLLDGENRTKMIKALKQKREGDLVQAKKVFEQLIIINANDRLNEFINRQKIDCTVLLSQWDQICKQSKNKREEGLKQSYQEMRMYTIALQNLQTSKRNELLLRQHQILIPEHHLQYEKGIICVMKQSGLDGAKYHALNSRQVFRKQWLRVSSFAFNSKHDLLQSLQKNHELSQFIGLYKNNETSLQNCKQLFSKWKNRQPNEIFDDNITWIQILSSRLLFGKMLSERYDIPSEIMAKSLTEWHVQMVNGMLQKGVLGYAQNTIRKAVAQHKLTREFNWDFYQSISQLKLLQLKKKASLKLDQYSIVPKLIQKEIDQFKVSGQYHKFRLMRIKNEYFEGFLEVSLNKRKQIQILSFVSRVIDIYNNYQQIQKGLKRCQQSPQSFRKEIHFDFTLFLENILSIIRGKFQIKQIKDELQKKTLTVKTVAQKFMQELVYSIKMLNLNTNASFNEEQGQKVFSMILKLIKIVQSDHRLIGSKFQEIISENQVPKWIFLYFIPQIIKNINDYELYIHFKQLFEYFLAHYPQALVYPFNCTYPRAEDCHTQVTQYLYKHLHQKMSKYFEFIDNLFVIQHPELRLKDILTKYLNHGQIKTAQLQLIEFIQKNAYLGKYNLRFNQNYQAKINRILDNKNKNRKDLQEHIRGMITNLDPSKCNMMKYFTKLSDGSLWFEEYNLSDWMKLQVPGITYNKFEEPQNWNKIYIESFDNNILTLTSIRKPKRVSLLGSNQKIYMLLVKGGQDVRLDQRVEELFDLVNRIFSNFPQTNKKQLLISRFEVIPMKPMFGVFEWVDKSQTLRSFLETELRRLKGKPNLNLANQNDAITTFVTYLNKISPGGDKYQWHRTLMQMPQQDVVRNMNKCQNQLPYGLLRYSLQKLAKNYDSFLHIKNKFINNYAAICLITYIFGIGDRHLQNFLIQTSTGSIIMIDFGYSFCSSIELPIPQFIPFRLTKSFDDLTKPIGIEGSFKKCLLACYEALNKKMQLIVDYCDVFVDDPLMEWVWISRKQLANSTNSRQIVIGNGTNNSFSVSQQAPQKKHFTSKIKIVENKLKGYNPRIILQNLLTESRHKQAPFIEVLRKAIWKKARVKEQILNSQDLISELLSLAGDKNITGRSYIGLNLFV